MDCSWTKKSCRWRRWQRSLRVHYQIWHLILNPRSNICINFIKQKYIIPFRSKTKSTSESGEGGYGEHGGSFFLRMIIQILQIRPLHTMIRNRRSWIRVIMKCHQALMNGATSCKSSSSSLRFNVISLCSKQSTILLCFMRVD